MTASILIPLKNDSGYLKECIDSCLKLRNQDFEIIILPDNKINANYPKSRIIPTGPLTPPKKRDIGIREAKGEIIAFLDDDVFVATDWLDSALENFQSSDIAAVGGPAVTPDTDSLMQRASGKVYESLLVSGNYRFRYLPQRKRFVDDFPSCNFLVRKEVLKEIGGFKNNFWPGEDTFLCREIVNKLKKKIIYDPNVLVYHHRRKLFTPHLKQITNYALHRGYFAKRFPENSLKIAYFLPSGLFIFTLLGWILLFTDFKLLFISPFVLYLIACLIVSLQKEMRLTPLVFGGIIFSHFAYGLYFLMGLFAKKLPEE